MPQFVLNPLASGEVVLTEQRTPDGRGGLRHRRRHHRPGDLRQRRRLAHDGAGGRRQPHHAGYRARPAPAVRPG
ncbi:MAG: hypothetical protein M0C28_44530 [Candidatus Moduliflexus flocculans]|nr:hypothetical protein [Candidatus Moduliflexus flocculans]